MAVFAPTDKRFRRAHISPRARVRFHVSPRHMLYVALLGAGVLYGAYRAFTLMAAADVLTVRRITVEGNSRLSQGEVLSLLDGLPGRHMLFLSLTDWRGKLLASPWVADAALRRVLPDTVDVVVSEHRPVGIGRLDGGLYVIDERGGIIDEFGPNHVDMDLPLIDGLAARGDGQTGRPAVDQRRAALALRLLASLQPHPDLAGRVSQVDVSDLDDAVVVLKGDTALVRIGQDEFVERLRSYLDLAPTLREKVPRIDYVDLRFGERVYVRPQVWGEE